MVRNSGVPTFRVNTARLFFSHFEANTVMLWKTEAMMMYEE